MLCDGCGEYSYELEKTDAGLLCEYCYRIYGKENNYYEKYENEET